MRRRMTARREHSPPLLDAQDIPLAHLLAKEDDCRLESGAVAVCVRRYEGCLVGSELWEEPQAADDPSSNAPQAKQGLNHRYDWWRHEGYQANWKTEKEAGVGGALRFPVATHPTKSCFPPWIDWATAKSVAHHSHDLDPPRTIVRVVAAQRVVVERR